MFQKLLHGESLFWSSLAPVKQVNAFPRVWGAGRAGSWHMVLWLKSWVGALYTQPYRELTQAGTCVFLPRSSFFKAEFTSVSGCSRDQTYRKVARGNPWAWCMMLSQAPEGSGSPG